MSPSAEKKLQSLLHALREDLVDPEVFLEVDEVANDFFLAGHKAAKDEARGLVEFVKKISEQVNQVRVDCNGKHSQYSSMHSNADKVCKKCGDNEDGPGGYITIKEPTGWAKLAKEALQKYEEGK